MLIVPRKGLALRGVFLRKTSRVWRSGTTFALQAARREQLTLIK